MQSIFILLAEIFAAGLASFAAIRTFYLYYRLPRKVDNLQHRTSEFGEAWTEYKSSSGEEEQHIKDVILLLDRFEQTDETFESVVDDTIEMINHRIALWKRLRRMVYGAKGRRWMSSLKRRIGNNSN